MSEVVHEIYVMCRYDGKDKYEAPVKVGISRNAKSRLSSIQTSCPFKLAIFCTLVAPCREWAEYVEVCFHDVQARHRTHGEWFDLSPIKAASLLCLAYDVAITMTLSSKHSEEEVERCREMAGINSLVGDLQKALGGVVWPKGETWQ